MARDDEEEDWREAKRRREEEDFDRWHAKREAERDADSGRYRRPGYSEEAYEAYDEAWQEQDQSNRYWEEKKRREEELERDLDEMQERHERGGKEERRRFFDDDDDSDYDLVDEDDTKSQGSMKYLFPAHTWEGMKERAQEEYDEGLRKTSYWKIVGIMAIGVVITFSGLTNFFGGILFVIVGILVLLYGFGDFMRKTRL
jgi:hypothetical protein